MQKNGRNGHFIVTGLAIGSLALCGGVWYYGQSLTDNTAIQRFNSSATAAAAVAGMLAAVVLFFYTYETWRLRKVAENQLEATIMPVVLLEISAAFSVGERPQVTLKFRNVGAGPAFNITVGTIVGKDGVSLHIGQVALLQSNCSATAESSVTNHGQVGGFALQPSLLDHCFENGKFPDETPLVVTCRGLRGVLYHTHQKIRWTVSTIRTEFIRIENDRS